jgi:hypothetical protein
MRVMTASLVSAMLAASVPQFILHLKSIGRRCAEAWLDASVNDIGVRSTVDLDKVFL